MKGTDMFVKAHSMRAALCTAALLGALGVSAAVAPQVMADAVQQPEAAQAQVAQQQAEAARPDADVQGILAAVRGGLVLDGLDVSVPEGTDVQITVQGGDVWVYQAAPGTEDAEATAEVPSSQAQAADSDASAEAPVASDVVEPIADLAQGLSSDPSAAPDAETQPQAPTWVEGAEGESGSWDTHGMTAEEAVLASISGGAYTLQADGAGTGAAQGFRGEVSVTATLAGGQVSLSASLPEGEEMDAEQAQSYLDALAQGGEVDAVSGATVTCEALRDAAASALVAATEGLEPSVAGDEAAWSATPLEEATKRAAALAEALDGRSVVAEDGTKAPAESVTWVVVGQDTAPDAAVAWQPAVQPASSDAHDLLVEDGTGAKGWWSAPVDQQPAPDQPAADPGQTVTPPAGDAQQPDEGDGGQDGEEAETPTDPEIPPAEGEGDQQPDEGTDVPADPGVTPPAEGGEGQQPDQPSDPGQGSEGDGPEDAGDDQQPGEGGEGDLPAEGGDDPTMPDGTPVEDTPSIDVEPTEPENPDGGDQPGEGTDEPTDPGVTPPAEAGEGQQPDQPSDPGQDQQPSDPVDPPQGGDDATVPENPGSGETGGETGGETQPEKVWVVDQEAYDEQVWVETKPAWDEQVWVVDVPASTTEQWVVDQAAWDEQVWVPNQVWVETSAAWDEPVYSYESVCNDCGAIITGWEDAHLAASIEAWIANGYVGSYCGSWSGSVPIQTGTIHHEAQGYYEDQGYWSTVHHEEIGHMETVTVPEQGHYETIHHEAEGYYETVHHEEVGHWEWR